MLGRVSRYRHSLEDGHFETHLPDRLHTFWSAFNFRTFFQAKSILKIEHRLIPPCGPQGGGARHVD
jgi:hypothetical protein